MWPERWRAKPSPRKRRLPELPEGEIPAVPDRRAGCWVALTTLASREEGERLAAALVEERLVACVNVIGGVASLYRWEGKVERGEEVLLALHPYDTPEFLAFEVGAGSAGYLAWVVDSVEPGRNEAR